jgi:phosphatidylinositol alpha 1,6-mannosyltransferase
MLVPPFRAEGFTAAIAELAQDPERRAAFGAAGRVAIEGRTWAAVGDELIGHYEAALHSSVSDRHLVAAA